MHISKQVCDKVPVDPVPADMKDWKMIMCISGSKHPLCKDYRCSIKNGAYNEQKKTIRVKLTEEGRSVLFCLSDRLSIDFYPIPTVKLTKRNLHEYWRHVIGK